MTTIRPSIVRGPLVHQKMNPFFQWISGSDEIRENAPKDSLRYRTNGSVLTVAKALWPLHVPLQAVGLVSKDFSKLAKAFYGSIWSVVYSAYRPFAQNRDLLVDPENGPKISDGVKKLYEINEHFRFGAGTLVSAIYGGGALGMMWNLLTRNSDGFEKAEKIYESGMFSQNAVFASMDFANVLKRKYNPAQLSEVDADKKSMKSRAEIMQSLLFIPHMITRAYGTLGTFGLELSDGLKKVENIIKYFGYGAWAARFGQVKQDSRHGGDLDNYDSSSSGKVRALDRALHDTQELSAKVFSTVLPGLSWLSAFAETFGFSEFAQKSFKLEGIIEKLLPMLSAWSIRGTWMRLIKGNLGMETGTSTELPGVGGTTQDVNKEITSYLKSPDPNIRKEILRRFVLKAKAGERTWGEVLFNVSRGDFEWRDIVELEQSGVFSWGDCKDVKNQEVIPPIGSSKGPLLYEDILLKNRDLIPDLEKIEESGVINFPKLQKKLKTTFDENKAGLVHILMALRLAEKGRFDLKTIDLNKYSWQLVNACDNKILSKDDIEKLIENRFLKRELIQRNNSSRSIDFKSKWRKYFNEKLNGEKMFFGDTVTSLYDFFRVGLEYDNSTRSKFLKEVIYAAARVRGEGDHRVDVAIDDLDGFTLSHVVKAAEERLFKIYQAFEHEDIFTGYRIDEPVLMSKEPVDVNEQYVVRKYVSGEDRNRNNLNDIILAFLTPG